MKYLLVVTLLMLTSCATQVGQSKEERKAEIYYQQGTSNLVKRNFTRALKDLLEAAKLNPKDSGIQNNLGMAFYFKKNVSKAKQHIIRSLELDPANTDARSNLASIYMEQGDYQNATLQYSKILKDLTYEKQFKTYYNLGIMSLKTRNNKRAVSYFTKSIEENKNYCPSHFQLGMIKYKAGYYKQSLVDFKNATKGVCVNNPAPHYYLGLSYMEAGIPSQAREKFEYVIEKHGKTKYGTLSQIKISSLKSKSTNPVMEASRKREFIKRKQLTPNF
jgi:type IV pilus assembly protein PilF